MERELVQLSKEISRALRHRPDYYELELDEAGWVPLEDLLEGIRNAQPRWRQVGEAEVLKIMEQSDKQRFELANGRIRAFYGHTIPQRMRREPAEPPALLYHGTAAGTVPLIMEQGLKPMRRQYVHLSADEATAQQVARRKGDRPVILRVKAAEAYRQGIPFYLGNQTVWLADAVPPVYLEEP